MSDPVKVTYIGGPTQLLEFGGIRLLTDPTFDDAGGQYPSGPAALHKLAAPAITLDRLGPFHYVLLSHDHHWDNLDHLGRQSLQRAKAVLTTEEGAARLRGNSLGMGNWEHRDLPAKNGRTLRVVGTPARHGPAGLERGAVTGFILSFTDSPQPAIYVSGDTIWYDGVAEVGRRFPLQMALLHVGAARVPAVGPFHLTMTSEEAVEAAKALPQATIVPTHFEGWEHFSEGKEEILRAFRNAGMAHRLHWPIPGIEEEIPIRAGLKRNG